jgi:hypothetical protein
LIHPVDAIEIVVARGGDPERIVGSDQQDGKEAAWPGEYGLGPAWCGNLEAERGQQNGPARETPRSCVEAPHGRQSCKNHARTRSLYSDPDVAFRLKGLYEKHEEDIDKR